jgi:hypothetical protein
MKLKWLIIILGVAIVVLLGVLAFVPGVRGPAGPGGSASTSTTGTDVTEAAISQDKHVEVGAPLADELVSSPARVAGNVTGGGWFFEASFPVKVVDADGTVLGQGQAQATPPEAWTSTGTVPFAATIAFTNPHSATGTVVLSKDNPSGLPQNDMSFKIPVRFNVPTSIASTSTPIFKNDSGVRGIITIGPTCPVEQMPPDPQCAPKPYPTVITVYPKNGSVAAAMVAPDAFGSYTVILPPGDYILSPKGGNPYPRCAPADVVVTAGSFSTINLSCDSGIR